MRVDERGHAGFDAQALQRRRQDGRQRRRGGRVRVLVGGDIEALGARCVQPGDRLAGATPDRPRAALEVRHLQPAARPGGTDGGDRLVERREQPVSLVAHVGRVKAAPPRCGRHQSLDLGRLGVHPGCIDEPRGQADRPGIERRVDLSRPCPPARRGSAAGASVPRTDARIVP